MMERDEFISKYASKLSSQQLAAVTDEEKNVLLLAVPGSGKTTVLVTRLTRLSVEEGDKVIHKKYGRGTVVGVKLGENGSAERIRVRLESGDVKLFTALAFQQGIMKIDDGE